MVNILGYIEENPGLITAIFMGTGFYLMAWGISLAEATRIGRFRSKKERAVFGGCITIFGLFTFCVGLTVFLKFVLPKF